MPGTRRGMDIPSAPTMTWYNKRNALGTSSSLPVTLENYREQLALSQISVLTKSDEDAVKLLRDNGYTKPILQYVLFTEVGHWDTDATGAYTSTAPRKNNWCFSSIPWRTAVEYAPAAWLHLASSTVSASAAGGATSVSVPNLALFQQVSGGSKGIVDVWDSGGTYLGKFHYTAKSGISGAGTLTVPTSGYGSIGYNPTTLSGVGTTNPQTGAAWALPTLASIPTGAVLRGRIRSGAISQSTNAGNTGHHFFMGDPSSTTFRDWCKASYLGYKASSPGGSTPTDRWDGIFFDNLHTEAEKLTGITSATYGNTPGFVYPTPITGSVWTRTEWDAANVAFISWIKANIPGLTLWGNAYPMEWGTAAQDITDRAAILADCLAYKGAGLSGVMLEDFPLHFTGGAVSYPSLGEWDNGLAFIDSLVAGGLDVLMVGQSATTGTPWGDTADQIFTIAAVLLCQSRYGPNTVYGRHTSASISGAYPQWWPSDAYHYRLGRPTQARQVSGTNPKIYTRTYQYGSVTVSYPASGTPTVTITRT
jgi:hypothetical protein